MYGQFDRVTHEWSDGTLANQMRLFVQDDTPDRLCPAGDGDPGRVRHRVMAVRAPPARAPARGG